MKGVIAMVRVYRYLLQDGIFLLALAFIGLGIVVNFEVFTGEAQMTTALVQFDEALAVGLVVCFGLCWRLFAAQRREMIRRAKAERRARELAHLDLLTGLPNRRQFDKDLKSAIAAPPSAEAIHAVFLLDLNGFKRINDVYGHHVGDDVLQQVALRLNAAVRQGDLVVRFGGDEFAILARQLSSAEQATSIARRIIAEIEAPLRIGNIEHKIGIGIGISLFHDRRDEPAEVVRRADVALYRAKAEHRSAMRFYDEEMDARLLERDQIERDLRVAALNGQIHPFYQPIVDLRTNRVTGFEALARWFHPDRGEITPDRFIPVAESCGLIDKLSIDLLREAAKTATSWPADVYLSFNISLHQLKDRTFGLKALRVLGEMGLAPQRLEIELTESALVQDLEGAQAVLGTLRDAGVRVALDDFGTGYSSLYHLRNFQVDRIKIDRSFISDVADAPNFVRALLGLGRGLGLAVTAEGVEQVHQAEVLLEQGCEQAQGYLFSRAVSAHETTKFVQLGRNAA
ncbi:MULTISPECIES: EAL domain-containing protein [unclassified Bradyrhizobium]|jgi:diguanylate cyclase (GGDEF)-like protein|uniref:putative bifunctional diguanylate cyclase/phosphodiesterase n=1 Tax=unclassified Bradyrhizobium TaxID=2631580 RepID=UPI0010438545|nr:MULTISPECIES: EAL domain-containing protein [unclassified Bradyrhizobium]